MARKLTFEERVERMDDGLRQLCTTIREAIPNVPGQYDRETDLPMHLNMLLHGGRTLNGASYEVITHIRNTLNHYQGAGTAAKRTIDLITAETGRRS